LVREDADAMELRELSMLVALNMGELIGFIILSALMDFV
jgi:hypothetical protein